MRFSGVWRRLRAPHLLVALVAALLALPVHAASSNAGLSLDATTRLAVRRAPQVRARLLRTQAAQHDAVRAGRWPDPTLTFGINNLTATGPQAFSAAADFMTMRSVGLMQVIPAHAKRAAEKAAAGAGVHLADANTVRTRLAVKRAAAQAWVALWAAQRKRKLLGDLHNQAGLAVKLAKARLAGGAGSATQVLAARSAVVELDNRITAATVDVAAARAALRRWIGDASATTLAAAPDFTRLPIPPATLQRDLNRQAPLLGWTAREAQAQAQLALAKAGKHSDWSVGLMYGSRIDRSDMIGIEVGVSLPLFAGNRQDQDVAARYAERDAVRAEHADARRAQRAAVAAELARWRGDSKQVQRCRSQLLPLAADRSRTALGAYRAGGPLQPWLDARRDEIDTRIACAKTLAAWGKAWAQLAYLIPRRVASSGQAIEEPLP